MPEMPSTVKLPLDELNPAVESTVSVVFRSVSVWAPLTFATPQVDGSAVLSVVAQSPLIEVPPPLS